jgi:site-specific DNA-methyltransferase (adenine-specific)/adenine-specific DNA-methyltransferase
LLALKALLPYYAGQVKCIYIDPPYNTGNENWVYNDNVSSPQMRDWLGKVVGSEGEDLSRHDKWLCMMYPRLVLLRELLREDGAVFVSIDDTQVAHLRCVMDEIFGVRNFVATFVWEKRTTRENRRVFSFNHDFILCFARNMDLFEATRGTLPFSEETLKRYSNPDSDPRGRWQSVSLNAQAGHGTPEQFYTITTPSGRKLSPPPGTCWRVTERRLRELIADNRIWFGPDSKGVPRMKVFLAEANQGLTPHTLWKAIEVGTTDTAKKALNNLFDGESRFETPKPIDLIQRILQIATDSDSIVLDSFAGSGTTGHAVLQLNKVDSGNRRFILVEMEPNIARSITAERLRRVVEGYGDVEGLGGGFRYCTLGATLFDADGQIRGEVKFDELARHVFFVETGEPLPSKTPEAERRGKRANGRTTFLGVARGVGVYLLYNGIRRDKSRDGGNVLTSEILSALPKHEGPKVIYGTGCRIGAARLKRAGITFRQIPYEVKMA